MSKPPTLLYGDFSCNNEPDIDYMEGFPIVSSVHEDPIADLKVSNSGILNASPDSDELELSCPR